MRERRKFGQDGSKEGEERENEDSRVLAVPPFLVVELLGAGLVRWDLLRDSMEVLLSRSRKNGLGEFQSLWDDGRNFAEGGRSISRSEASSEQTSLHPRRDDAREVEANGSVGESFDLLPSVDEVLDSSLWEGKTKRKSAKDFGGGFELEKKSSSPYRGWQQPGSPKRLLGSDPSWELPLLPQQGPSPSR